MSTEEIVGDKVTLEVIEVVDHYGDQIVRDDGCGHLHDVSHLCHDRGADEAPESGTPA